MIITDLSNQPLRSVQKPSFKRNKPTAKQRGAISPSVRQALKARSEGLCERCKAARAVHAAHITRRWKLDRTTVFDLLHLCERCHVWCDTTKDGRAFLAAAANAR